MARPDEQPPSQQEEPVAQTQIQLSETPQTNDHSQVVILNNSESQTPHTSIRKVQVLPIVSLAIRIATWVCLLVSLSFLASDSSYITFIITKLKIGFSDIYAYRYMMSAIVIGFAYTSIQVAFEIYQLAMRKCLTKGSRLPDIIFYGDMFLLSFLATGVGAAFGATFDLKKNFDQLVDFVIESDDELVDESLIYQMRSKLDNFFNLAYVSAGFLLFAFLGSLASSIVSSLALRRK